MGCNCCNIRHYIDVKKLLAEKEARKKAAEEAEKAKEVKPEEAEVVAEPKTEE